jgi:hypothetical protein
MNGFLHRLYFVDKTWGDAVDRVVFNVRGIRPAAVLVDATLSMAGAACQKQSDPRHLTICTSVKCLMWGYIRPRRAAMTAFKLPNLAMTAGAGVQLGRFGQRSGKGGVDGHTPEV